MEWTEAWVLIISWMVRGCLSWHNFYQRRRKDFDWGGTVCNKLLCSTEHIWNRLKTLGGGGTCPRCPPGSYAYVYVVTLPVTMFTRMLYNTLQVIGEYITQNIQQLHVLGIAQEWLWPLDCFLCWAQDYSNISTVTWHLHEYVWSQVCSECNPQVMNNNAELWILTSSKWQVAS